MRSLEIRTERIFNNLIKENQKLAADFVLKQSKSVSSAQSPMSSVKSPEFSVQSQHPASRVQCPESSVESSASRFRVQRPEYNVQSRASRYQRSEPSVQSPTSNSCVQSPGIPVCPLQMNICQSNTHKKNLSWLHFDDEPRVQERQQVKDQQSCISVFAAYPTLDL